MKLIDKSALVAEIKRRMKLRQDGYRKYNDVSDFVAFEELEYLHDEFLPTLEVKEVDLDTEIAKWEESFKHCPASMGYKETAKHFFELGMRFSAIGSDYIEGVRGYYETTTK